MVLYLYDLNAFNPFITIDSFLGSLVGWGEGGEIIPLSAGRERKKETYDFYCLHFANFILQAVLAQFSIT